MFKNVLSPLKHQLNKTQSKRNLIDYQDLLTPNYEKPNCPQHYYSRRRRDCQITAGSLVESVKNYPEQQTPRSERTGGFCCLRAIENSCIKAFRSQRLA
ncbi:MAG: hypothetical protein ACI8WB_001098 [Phenylobacterium sp.]|jgi:hypothetical protein